MLRSQIEADFGEMNEPSVKVPLPQEFKILSTYPPHHGFLGISLVFWRAAPKPPIMQHVFHFLTSLPLRVRHGLRILFALQAASDFSGTLL